MSKVGYHTAASGVMSYQLALDITANNLANVNTNGFKASRPKETMIMKKLSSVTV